MVLAGGPGGDTGRGSFTSRSYGELVDQADSGSFFDEVPATRPQAVFVGDLSLHPARRAIAQLAVDFPEDDALFVWPGTTRLRVDGAESC